MSIKQLQMEGIAVARYDSYRRAFGEALAELGGKCRDLVVLDADTPRSTGTILFAERFPERFVNVGISEQDLVATAAGLAIAGKIPVAAAFAVFLMRGWEQIRNTIARDGLNVKLVGTHSGFSAHLDGSSHQSLEDIAVMRTLPRFTVLVPADAVAVRSLTRQAVLEHRGPLYMRLGRDNAPVVYSEEEELRIGGARVLEEAGDAVIFTCGAMVGVALEASRILAGKGLRVGVVDVYTVKPLDEETILRQARKAGLVVTLEEHSVVGGLGSAIAELLAEKMPKRVLRLGVAEAFGTSARSYEQLLEYMKLAPSHVAKAIGGELG